MGALGVAQSPLTVETQISWDYDAAIIALRSKQQPLCGDAEGWGPISPSRFDFTPCFLDIWIVLVAAWGIFFGAGAAWYLVKRRMPQDVARNWHFYIKLWVNPELQD